MRDQKQDLEVQIAQLEADLKNVRLAQTRCKVQLDDSRLAEIKRSLADLRNRLKVEKTQAELEGEFANDPISVDKQVPAGQRGYPRSARVFPGQQSAERDGREEVTCLATLLEKRLSERLTRGWPVSSNRRNTRGHSGWPTGAASRPSPGYINYVLFASP